MGVEVREARPDEYERAGEVAVSAYREFARPEDAWEDYLRQIGDVPARARVAHVLLALEDDDILGTATLELERRIEDDDPPLAADEAHIRMLGVRPDARGRGIARALMDGCFARALTAGRTRITLHTTHRMKAAQRMYERMGFERLDDRVFPDGFVLLTYQKRIG